MAPLSLVWHFDNYVASQGMAIETAKKNTMPLINAVVAKGVEVLQRSLDKVLQDHKSR